MQMMLQISLMVLQSMMIDEVKFDNECEMNVNDGIHGWMEEKLVGSFDDMENV
jgi:hypothetical protein